MYETLILRIEDPQEPGCLVRLYDGETAVAESLADTPQLAMANAVQLARAHLKDDSVTEESLRWVQVP
jgi:hypothetical protein